MQARDHFWYWFSCCQVLRIILASADAWVMAESWGNISNNSCTSFPGIQNSPQIGVWGLFLPPYLLPHHREDVVYFFPWNTLTISKKHTYYFRDNFNILKFCLKSAYENTRRSSLKTRMLGNEQSPGSFLHSFSLCSGDVVLPWHQEDQSNFWPGVFLWLWVTKTTTAALRLPPCLEFQL